MLIDLVKKEDPGGLAWVIAAAAVSGIANTATLAIVNAVASDQDHASAAAFVWFIVALLAYVIGLRLSVGRMSRNIEAALYRLRVDVANRIRRAELNGIEEIGVTEIYERLTEQTSIVSNSAWPLALGFQAAVMLTCTVLYLWLVSTHLLLIAVVIYGLGGLYYASRQPRVTQSMQEAARTRMRLFERLNDLLHGFKEVRLRKARSDDLHADFGRVATTLKETAVKSNILTQENFVFAQLLQFSMIGVAAFVLPQYTKMDSHATMASVSALLLVLGPLSQVLFVMPLYQRANLAARNIVELQDRLQKTGATTEEGKAGLTFEPFSELRIDRLEFRRLNAKGQEVFKVGPVSLTVRAGEILFLVGGNGSGKTTLLRTMTALYPPSAGTLFVNGVAIHKQNRQVYREMIAAIFSDFHLFRKFYGLGGVSGAEVQALLEKMQLARQTALIEGEWKTLDLSTGQRKRMAMVTALLEDRPIYVFDEWAADQDPEFRQYFYEVLLQDLKKRGKAVIAISHDDRYFSFADQVVTLEYGQLTSIKGRRSPVETEPSPSE